MSEDPIKLGFWAELIEYVAKRLPPLLAAFGFGYHMGKREVDEKDKELLKLRLDLEKEKNEDDVEEANRGKSDADLVRDAIAEGKRLRR